MIAGSGRDVTPVVDGRAEPTFAIGRAVFLRVLGGALVVAFVALWQQAPGLIGPDGITPLSDLLAGWRRPDDGILPGLLRAPSLFWFAATPLFVGVVILLGIAAGLMLLVGVLPRMACLLGYLAWLSFRATEPGGVAWFNYPFDDLQTELLVLGCLIAPAGGWLSRADPRLPRWARWLVVWLAFRVLFGPGIAKVLYHEPWRDLSAVGDFLLTMPHPTPLAAWFHDLGSPWLALMTGAALLCELGLPLLFFVPGRPRRFAAAGCIGFMVGIQLVCNIRGFQLLTAALLVLLWDDAALRGLWGRVTRRGEAPTSASNAMTLVAARGPSGATTRATTRLPVARRVALGAGAFVYAAATVGPFLHQFRLDLGDWSPPAQRVAARLAPLRLASCYTMFCIMPRERFVLVVQGSSDGATWRDYELLGPPAQVERSPTFFAPYHDYLGFRLWFAAFCPPQGDAWLRSLQARLLAGEPAVERLFWRRPFDAPPSWLRIAWYRYDYAPPAERAMGVHWRREWLGVRVPPRQRVD